MRRSLGLDFSESDLLRQRGIRAANQIIGSERMPELNSKTFLSTLLHTEILSEQRIAEIEREFGEDCSPQLLAIQLVRSGELTSWQAKFLLSGREGLRVGKYILRERLSQDELGDRILAIHQLLDRPVDLQILPVEANEESPAFQAFLQHASNAAHLDHPNLIHVYDIDQEGGRHYLVSEHFVGQSLDQLFPTATQWNIVKIGSIARQLIGGIFHAHSENVVHGDIGPKTILIAYDGTAKVGNLAISALRRVIEEHRSGHPVTSSPSPESDYQDCVKTLLRLIDDCQASSLDERRQLKDILEPLSQSAAERDAETTIFKLDEWLERHQPPKKEDNKTDEKKAAATSDLSLLNTLVGRTTVQTANRANPMRPVNRVAQPKVPIGRLASLVSLGALLILLGWTWYRANRGPEQQSAARTSTGEQPNKPPETRKKNGPTKSGTAKATTETAARKDAKVPPDDKSEQPPPTASLEPVTAESQDVHDPAEKSADEPQELGDQVPSEQIPAETVPSQLVPKVTDDPPPAVTAQPPAPDIAVTDKQDAAPSAATDAGSSAPASTTGPFATTPRAVDLLAAGPSSEVTLGQVDPGNNFLLACSLVTNDAVTRRTKFSLERDAGDQSQVWTVVGDTSAGQPTPIAKLSLVGTDLKFQWLINPKSALNYSFLCNCLLVMQAGEEKFLLRLRKPIAIGDAKVTADEPQAKLDFNLESFPFESGMVTTEFVKIDEVALAQDDEDFTWVIEPADQIVPERAPLFVFMTDQPARFLFLEISSKIAKQSEITATLRIQQNPRPKLYSERTANELDVYLKAAAVEIGNTYQQALAYEAPDGKKRDHAKLVKELKANLESAQLQIVDWSVQKRRAAALASRPIRCRVYFTLEDAEIDLATWDGEPHPAK